MAKQALTVDNPFASLIPKESTADENYDVYISESAEKYGLDPKLLKSMMHTESSGDKSAVSKKGASGLMQLMPKTAKAMGVTDIFDPKQNIDAGAKYFSEQLKATGGDVDLALARYNAGPTAVKKHGGIPDFPETKNYIKKVNKRYNESKVANKPLAIVKEENPFANLIPEKAPELGPAPTPPPELPEAIAPVKPFDPTKGNLPASAGIPQPKPPVEEENPFADLMPVKDKLSSNLPPSSGIPGVTDSDSPAANILADAFSGNLPAGAGYLQEPISKAVDFYKPKLKKYTMSVEEEKEMRGKYPNLMALRYAAASILAPGIGEKIASPEELEKFLNAPANEQSKELLNLTIGYTLFTGVMKGVPPYLAKTYPFLNTPVLKSIKDSVWFRKLTIKERGVALQSAARKKTAGMSDAEINESLKTYYENKFGKPAKKSTAEPTGKVYKEKPKPTEEKKAPPKEDIPEAETVIHMEPTPRTQVPFEAKLPKKGRKGEGFDVTPAGTPEPIIRRAYPTGAEYVAGKPQDADIDYIPVGKRESKKGNIIPFKLKTYAEKKLESYAKERKLPESDFEVKKIAGGYVVQRKGVPSEKTKFAMLRNGRSDAALKGIVTKARNKGLSEKKIALMPEARVLAKEGKLPDRKVKTKKNPVVTKKADVISLGSRRKKVTVGGKTLNVTRLDEDQIFEILYKNRDTLTSKDHEGISKEISRARGWIADTKAKAKAGTISAKEAKQKINYSRELIAKYTKLLNYKPKIVETQKAPKADDVPSEVIKARAKADRGPTAAEVDKLIGRKSKTQYEDLPATKKERNKEIAFIEEYIKKGNLGKTTLKAAKRRIQVLKEGKVKPSKQDRRKLPRKAAKERRKAPRTDSLEEITAKLNRLDLETRKAGRKQKPLAQRMVEKEAIKKRLERDLENLTKRINKFDFYVRKNKVKNMTRAQKQRKKLLELEYANLKGHLNKLQSKKVPSQKVVDQAGITQKPKGKKLKYSPNEIYTKNSIKIEPPDVGGGYKNEPTLHFWGTPSELMKILDKDIYTKQDVNRMLQEVAYLGYENIQFIDVKDGIIYARSLISLTTYTPKGGNESPIGEVIPKPKPKQLPEPEPKPEPKPVEKTLDYEPKIVYNSPSSEIKPSTDSKKILHFDGTKEELFKALEAESDWEMMEAAKLLGYDKIQFLKLNYGDFPTKSVLIENAKKFQKSDSYVDAFGDTLPEELGISELQDIWNVGTYIAIGEPIEVSTIEMDHLNFKRPKKKVKVKKEDREIVLGSRLAKAEANLTLTKQRLFKDSEGQSYPHTIIGELIQNSEDAVRGFTDLPIEIHIKDGVLTVVDHGKGMSPPEMEEDWVTLFEQGTKSENDLGGFGFAKLPIMGWPDTFKVYSVWKDPKTGMKYLSRVNGNREDYMEHHLIPYNSQIAPPGSNTGTVVTLKKSKDLDDYDMINVVEELAKKHRTGRPLKIIHDSGYGDLDIKDVSSPKWETVKSKYPKLAFKAGESNVEVKFVKSTPPYYSSENGYPVTTNVYNKGLRLPDISQYTDLGKFRLSKKPDFTIEINFLKTPAASESLTYPFTVNRTRLLPDVEKKIKQEINAVIRTLEAEIGAEQQADIIRLFGNAPKVGGTKLIIPFKENHIVSEVSEVINRYPDLFDSLGKLYGKFNKILTRYTDVPEHEYAITTYAGVHGFRPKSGILPKDYIVANPFSYLSETYGGGLSLAVANTEVEMRKAAALLIETLTHEAAHSNQSGHWASFMAEYSRIYGDIQSHTKNKGIGELEEIAYEFFKEYGKDIKDLTEAIRGIQNQGNLSQIFSEYTPEQRAISSSPVDAPLEKNARRTGKDGRVKKKRKPKLLGKFEEFNYILPAYGRVIRPFTNAKSAALKAPYEAVKNAGVGDLLVIHPPRLRFGAEYTIKDVKVGWEQKDLIAALTFIRQDLKGAIKRGADVLYINSVNKDIREALKSLGFQTKNVRDTIVASNLSAYNRLKQRGLVGDRNKVPLEEREKQLPKRNKYDLAFGKKQYKSVMTRLDWKLTGQSATTTLKTYNDTAGGNIEEFLTGEMYYLSDGGYSRLYWDEFNDKGIQIAGESTKKAKAAFAKNKDLIEKANKVLRQYEKRMMEPDVNTTKVAGFANKLLDPLRNERGSVPVGELANDLKRSTNRTGKLLDYYVGVLSTRAEKIDPSIKNILMEYELDSSLKIEDITKHVLPLIKVTHKMPKKDYKRFDLARKNSDTETINELLDKYENIGLKEQYANWRFLDDALIDAARNAGFKVNYLQEHNPREVKDFEGLMDYLWKTGNRSTVDLFIRARERKLDRPLTRNEKIQLLNSIFRGYADERITLSKPGQLKLRKLRTLTPEMNKFFSDSNSAMLRYISDVVSAIEARKIFGKGVNPDSIIYNLENTIGAYVLDLAEVKNLSPSQELELRSILKARFNAHGTQGAVTLLKNLSLIDVLGSQASALRQVGDMGWPLIENGLLAPLKVLPKAIFRMSDYTKASVGISKVGAEFSDKSTSAKVVDALFKATGLTGIDAIMKEVLMNSSYIEAVRKARSKKPTVVAEFMQELYKFLPEDQAHELMQTFRNRGDSRNVKLFLLRVLSKYQPVTLLEMPQGFVEGGNVRIAYTLKSFDIKRLDVYRTQVLQKITSKDSTPKERIQGIKNLFTIALFFTMMEATGDMLIDLFRGKPVNYSDMFIRRLSSILISRYLSESAKRQGFFKSLLSQTIPPTRLIDALVQDFSTAGDDKGLESIRAVPLIGDIYYHWLGKGSRKIAAKILAEEKAKDKAKQTNTIRRVRPKVIRPKVQRNTIRRQKAKRIK